MKPLEMYDAKVTRFSRESVLTDVYLVDDYIHIKQKVEHFPVSDIHTEKINNTSLSITEMERIISWYVESLDKLNKSDIELNLNRYFR